MMNRRSVYQIIILVLLTALLSVRALAAEAAATGETLSAKAGETVTFSVDLSDNPGLAAWMFHLTWDDSVLQYVPDSAEAGEAFAKGALLENAETGKLTVSWYNTKDVTDGGTAFTAQFTVVDDAYSGDYTIGVDCSAPNTINVEEQQVPVVTADGKVTVKGVNRPEQSPPSGGEDKKVPDYDHGLTLNYNQVTLSPSGSKQLTVAEEKKELQWYSSDETVVAVEDGKLKAVGSGSTTVTVMTPDGQEQSSCVVTVAEKGGGAVWIIVGAVAAAAIAAGIVLGTKRKKNRAEGKQV